MGYWQRQSRVEKRHVQWKVLFLGGAPGEEEGEELEGGEVSPAHQLRHARVRLPAWLSLRRRSCRPGQRARARPWASPAPSPPFSSPAAPLSLAAGKRRLLRPPFPPTAVSPCMEGDASRLGLRALPGGPAGGAAAVPAPAGLFVLKSAGSAGGEEGKKGRNAAGSLRVLEEQRVGRNNFFFFAPLWNGRRARGDLPPRMDSLVFYVAMLSWVMRCWVASGRQGRVQGRKWGGGDEGGRKGDRQVVAAGSQARWREAGVAPSAGAASILGASLDLVQVVEPRSKSRRGKKKEARCKTRECLWGGLRRCSVGWQCGSAK